jgi:hypothetical protein
MVLKFIEKLKMLLGFDKTKERRPRYGKSGSYSKSHDVASGDTSIARIQKELASFKDGE